MAEEEKKNIFEKAFDAIGPRAELNDLEELKKKVVELEAQLAAANKATADAQAAEKKAADDAKAAAAHKPTTSSSSDSQAIKRAESAEKQVRELTAELQRFRLEKAREDWEAKHPGVVAPKFLAVHELKSDETLSHLALKYYGHATPTYWKLIYEANKELIGDNPNKVRPGSNINIPELPEELKDK